MSEKVELLTINQAAELISGLTKHRVRIMCVEGTLPHIMAGKKYLINKSVLLEILNSKNNFQI